MKLLYTSLLGLASAAVIKRQWSCPALIQGCTKSYLVTYGTCDSVAAANGITTDKFFELNPSINRPSCNNMFSGCYYCVAKDTVSPVCPTDYNTQCNKFYEVKSGDICWTIVNNNPPLSLNQLYDWNPSIHRDTCDNLIPQCKYCVGVGGVVDTVPQPHQPNIRQNCKEYYQAQSGDYCYKISIEKGVNLADFMSWNPDVGPGCLNMLAGYWYCLRI
ncbi:hypothetical protein CC78DRAFT_537450 [Lojkania enalia]|uniref:LysM domain-containing protein n=1 Tax=Lojkania enalia TaxID=147567 RepID=A0A9P4JXT3_9PLEO|nr:hypothetical protein CC78DRAFT_537450 [Didymosphaeria enalia]